MRKDAEQVSALLFAGSQVSVRDRTGHDALYYGVHGNSPEVVRLLLQYGADVNAKDPEGRSPLHLAVSSISSKEDGYLVDLLLNKGADNSSQDAQGNTPLHLLLSQESHEGSRWTTNKPLQRLMKSNPNVNAVNHAGLTPLHMLLERPATDTSLGRLADILKAGASPTIPFPDQRLPVEAYLKRWNDALAGHSSLRYSYTSRQDVLRVLAQFFNAGADPNANMSSRIPFVLHYFGSALFRSFAPAVREEQFAAFLCRIADPHVVGPDGNSLLHEIIKQDNKPARGRPSPGSIFESLLKKGADPNLRNHAGQTPFKLLHQLKSLNISQITEYGSTLMTHGADPLLLDASGLCDFFDAASNKKVSMSWLGTLVRTQALIGLAKRLGTECTDNVRTLWRGWEEAWSAVSWSDARRGMVGWELDCLTAESAQRVRRVLYVKLANKHLDGLKNQMDKDIEERRVATVQILRDMRAFGIEPDTVHLDYLLEVS
jgi:ankyrin repeat protein